MPCSGICYEFRLLLLQSMTKPPGILVRRYPNISQIVFAGSQSTKWVEIKWLKGERKQTDEAIQIGVKELIILVLEQIVSPLFPKMSAYVFIYLNYTYIDFQLFGHFDPFVTWDVDLPFQK